MKTVKNINELPKNFSVLEYDISNLPVEFEEDDAVVALDDREFNIDALNVVSTKIESLNDDIRPLTRK